VSAVQPIIAHCRDAGNGGATRSPSLHDFAAQSAPGRPNPIAED
jgi:hypothetical protein